MSANKKIPQREGNKFVVWKREDLDAVIAGNPQVQVYFGIIVDAIYWHRESQGKDDNKYIVCNQDEPYADQVWRTILEGEMEKAGIDPDDTWTCGICGAIKMWDEERPVHDVEVGECCAEHYEESGS